MSGVTLSPNAMAAGPVVWARRLAVLAVIAVAAGLPAMSAASSGTSRVTVEIEGVRSDQGTVRVGVFNRSDDFPSEGRIAGVELSAQEGSITAVIPGLAPGEYAIAIHHDEDGDGEFDTDFIGIPLEGYGFSNDAPVAFGPPDFEDAAIRVTDADVRTALRVRY